MEKICFQQNAFKPPSGFSFLARCIRTGILWQFSYKFKRIVGKPYFSDQLKNKISKRYKRVGYVKDVMWQSACLVVNLIMVYSYGFRFDYTMVGQASDSLNSHMASCLQTSQIGKHKVLISSSDLPVWPSLSV